jgi:hypothetical protein
MTQIFIKCRVLESIVKKEVERFRRGIKKKYFFDLTLTVLFFTVILAGSVAIYFISLIFGIDVLNFVVVTQIAMLLLLFWIINYLREWLP